MRHESDRKGGRASAKTPWPSDAEEYMVKLTADRSLWPWLWGEVQGIVKAKNQPFMKERPPQPTRSKTARRWQRLAARHRRVGDVIRAANCEAEANFGLNEAREDKRHGVTDATYRTLELMKSIYEMTDRWHDKELAGLLRCAGYRENWPTPEEHFRKLRVQYRNLLPSIT